MLSSFLIRVNLYPQSFIIISVFSYSYVLYLVGMRRNERRELKVMRTEEKHNNVKK